RYGVPYFANFINSDMKPEDARSMCCRLRLDNRELRDHLKKHGGGLFGANPLTGSIGVVTLNMPRLGTDTGNAAPFVLAPREEQTRIADQLDTLLVRIQTCNDHLAAIPALLKRFREAVLVNAINGALTAEWRTAHLPVASAAELLRSLEADHAEAGGHQRGNASEPSEEAHDLSVDQFPNGWEISTLRACCRPGRPITYGILKPGPELDEGVPYVRVADFPGNQLNLSSIKRTSSEIDLQYKRARLTAGDLLLSIRGSVGRLIVIPPSLEGANITQDTARLSISSRLNARYIYYALLSPDAQRRMTKAIRGVAVRGINIGDVRALQVPLPPLPEQDEIVRRIDALFEIAARIEASHATARRQVSRLTPLTLVKAFRGELVSQDPSDEPAIELFARIAAQRESATSVLKIRQPRAPRVARAPKDSTAMTKSRQDDDVKGKPYLAGHLRRLGEPVAAQVLFKASELPVADFYKQLAWEVAQGLVKDNTTTLEPGHAAG
ncbi:MAG: restriction endonuclease subunit S, partial [Hydrogenophaga sp.]|nr:restriction endonuclease subunit S [Hydrogenophaga sp.]